MILTPEREKQLRRFDAMCIFGAAIDKERLERRGLTVHRWIKGRTANFGPIQSAWVEHFRKHAEDSL